MGKNTKYVMCSGLAFAEEYDMKKLSNLAKEGWILESFKYLSYKLVKSTPEDVIYCIDYNEDKEDLDSYFEIFKDSGWEYICSSDGYRFFKAKKGTAPVYSDEDTKSVKYKKLYDACKKSTLYMFIITLILGLILFAMTNMEIGINVPKSIKVIISSLFGGIIGLEFMFFICTMLIKKKITSNKLI